MDEDQIMHDALYTFGPDCQQKMLLEEMAELQKEICKRWRGADNLDAISEEMADVYIMLDQMKILFGNAEQIDRHRRSKLRRLAYRIFDAKYPFEAKYSQGQEER